MSSSRSVAAARQRRAGTTDAPPIQRGPTPSISSSHVFSQKTKTIEEPPMTFIKAITLITLRLSRIETIVQNIIDVNQVNPQTDENVKIVGDDVINMIMSRLDAIETKQNKESEIELQLQDIETRMEESSEIIMNLQTFTMDTNQSVVKKQIADCVEKSKVAIESKISKSNLSILKLQSSIMELTQKLALLELSDKNDESVETILPILEIVEQIEAEITPVSEIIELVVTEPIILSDEDLSGIDII